MRSTFTRKSIAVAYGLGLIWTVAMVGGAHVLTPPLLELYRAIGIESVTVHAVATFALVILLATTVTVVVGLALRAGASRTPDSPAKAATEVASNHA